MIGYIKGHLLEESDGKLLITVGHADQGCVGYSVTVPQSGGGGGAMVGIARLEVGQVIELFIYSHIREDAFDLYGFQSRMEKELFLTLLSVNGIGPKSALGILSAVSSYAFVAAVIREDQAFLTKIPGIGKKTAERAVLELRDPVRKKVEAGLLQTTPISEEALRPSSFTARMSSVEPAPTQPPSRYAVEMKLFMEAKEALLSLGYREHTITPVLRQMLDPAIMPPLQSSEALIKAALKQLM